MLQKSVVACNSLGMEGRMLVKDWMKRWRVSNAELAREMGVDPSTIWRFLSGNNKRVSPLFLTAAHVAMEKIESRTLKSGRVRSFQSRLAG
jgi:IS30 family transposase